MNKSIKILKLNITDYDQVQLLIKNVIIGMKQNNIDQWDDLYPDSTILLSDIESQCAFGLFIDAELIGYIVLNEDESPEYNDVNWKNIIEKRLIIHRLCINYNYQNSGYAGKLVRFAEEYGKLNGYKSIRLDAFVKNNAALKIYEKNNYTFRGVVSFRKRLFNCYEKELV